MAVEMHDLRSQIVKLEARLRAKDIKLVKLRAKDIETQVLRSRIAELEAWPGAEEDCTEPQPKGRVIMPSPRSSSPDVTKDPPHSTPKGSR